MGTTAAELAERGEAYAVDHPRLVLDQNARSVKNSRITEVSPGEWQVEQILLDSAGEGDWLLISEARITDGVVHLKMVRLGAI